MKKDTLKDGIGFIDDDLIYEAEKASGLSYRAKIRIIRMLFIGAAAAVMITTAVLLHAGWNRKSSGDGGENTVPAPESASDESGVLPDEGQQFTVTASDIAGEPVTVTAITSAASAPEVTTVSAKQGSPAETSYVPAEEETTVTRSYAIDGGNNDPDEFTFDKDGLFKVPENYSYAGDPDVVCVKYSNSYLRERYGLWINCDTAQSDRDLDMVSGFELSDIYEEIEFEGGGFLLRVYYRDGTFMEYELYEYGLVDITDRSGKKQRWKDLSGNSYQLLLQLQSDQLSVDDKISMVIDEMYD